MHSVVDFYGRNAAARGEIIATKARPQMVHATAHHTCAHACTLVHKHDFFHAGTADQQGYNSATVFRHSSLPLSLSLFH